ncbi:MAG: hypothetical protein ABFD53_02680 [Anaerolineaceae bacterium]
MKRLVGEDINNYLARILNRLFASGVFLLLLLIDVSSAYGLMPGIEQSPISGITPICAIQGDYFKSDYVEQVVRTQGIVTADLDITSQKGFFIQKESCDGDPATSDGIFIDLQSKQDIVAAGDEVEVLGVV